MRPQRPEWAEHDSIHGPTGPGPRCMLTDDERTRVSQASADLDEARLADLTQLDTAGSIRMIERLRSSLDDVLQLLRDLQN
jgi:hypothetical protein